MDQDRLNKFLGKKDDDDYSYKKELEVLPIGPGGGRKKPGYRPIIDLDDYDGFNEATKDLSLDDVDPKLRPVLQQAITKYPFAKNALDAALHMMMDQMKSDFKQDMEINRLDKENDTQDQEIDDLERKVTKEHCGDPMAPDHKQGRILLMKLYKKEMQCVPGSPEHFEVVKMIDGCRKNIGLDEGMMGDIATAISKPVKAVVDKTVKDYKNRKRLFGKGKVA